MVKEQAIDDPHDDVSHWFGRRREPSKPRKQGDLKNDTTYVHGSSYLL